MPSKNSSGDIILEKFFIPSLFERSFEYTVSSKPSFSKPTENVFSGLLLLTTKLESTPPDKNAPTSTSLI